MNSVQIDLLVKIEETARVVLEVPDASDASNGVISFRDSDFSEALWQAVREVLGAGQ